MKAEHALELAERDEKIDQLKEQLRKSMINLEKVKDKKAELIEAAYQGSYDATSTLNIKPVRRPPADLRRKIPEVAVSHLSDWQLAKLTPSYNTEICEERVELYGDKVIKLTDIQRSDHPVKQLNVWALGDIVEGELIFPGQQHLIDSSLYRQVSVDGPRIMINYLRKMLGKFDRVCFTGVIGNHGALGGRSRRDYDPESNADRMLYRNVANVFEAMGEKRITFKIPEGPHDRNWYAIDNIGHYKALLFHGDQVRGQSGIPWYGFNKKVLGWAVGAIREPFDEFACGHYHTGTLMTLNSKSGYVNGSTESYNTFAQEQLAASGRPMQWLTFVNPDNGRGEGLTTAMYRVWLDENEYMLDHHTSPVHESYAV